MSSYLKSGSGGSSNESETLSSSTLDVSDTGSSSRPYQRNRQVMVDGEVKKTLPRGHFKQPSPWSEDKSTAYYQGAWQKVVWPALKTCFMLGVAAVLRRLNFSWPVVGFCVLVFIGLYQRVVALAMGWIYMPPMDQACYISTSKSLVNYMSVTGFEGGVLTEEDCRKLQRQSVQMYPKMAYKVNSLFGDLYYSKMSQEEAFEKGYTYLSGDQVVRSQHEVDCFVRDNINIKMPLDGPQWRVWWTRMKDDDGKEFTVQIWKSHHSLMDGVSCMGVTASMMDEYSLDYFIKVKPISLIQQILLKLSTVIFIPKLFMDSAMSKRDQNIMTAGKKRMQGIVNASSSQKIPMIRIKELSKKVGCTVNDILMSATSSAFKQYFRIRGDKLGTMDDGDSNSQINVLMPANIRFEMYPTRESVQMENCFAALPMKMPLVSTMKGAYQKIKKATSLLKSQAAYVYASYAVTYWTTVFAARWVPRVFLHNTSMKFTMAFSNVPGPVKAWYTTNGEGERCYGTWCQTYVTLAGRVGICVSCISYADNYKISVTADETVCPDTRFLVDTIQKNIENEIDSLSSFPVPKPCYDAKLLRPEILKNEHKKIE